MYEEILLCCCITYFEMLSISIYSEQVYFSVCVYIYVFFPKLVFQQHVLIRAMTRKSDDH